MLWGIINSARFSFAEVYNLSKIYDFLKECGTFYVLTINGDFPAGRPFGAVMEYNDNLYISTADTKAVYKQLKEHSNIQIISLKPGTREWVRINGIVKECDDIEIKEKMLEECPALTKHFPTPNTLHYAVFQLKIFDFMFY